MSIPNYQDLMLPVLRRAGEGKDVWLRQVIQNIADELALSLEDRAALVPSGQKTILTSRVQWAKTYLTKAGLLESVRRGLFRITDRGRQLLAQSPACINNETLSQYEEFRQYWRARDTLSDATTAVPGVSEQSATLELPKEDKTPTEIIRAAQTQLDADLAEELIKRILDMPPDFFERLVVNLVVAMGYGVTAIESGKAIGGTGDNGVDGVIHQDALGLDRVYIQAKRYGAGSWVSGPDIRGFYGSLTLKKATKGVFVTTSNFSQQAKENAASFPSRIALIDGAQLAALMIRYNVGCRVEETIQVKRVDEDFFE